MADYERFQDDMRDVMFGIGNEYSEVGALSAYIADKIITEESANR